jgi:hypothetical protein
LETTGDSAFLPVSGVFKNKKPERGKCTIPEKNSPGTSAPGAKTGFNAGADEPFLFLNLQIMISSNQLVPRFEGNCRITECCVNLARRLGA